jgi:hypothetical protein
MSPSPAITVPMRGAFPDAAGGSGTFEGTLAITSFVREADLIFAVGMLTGTLTDSRGHSLPGIVEQMVRLPVEVPAPDRGELTLFQVELLGWRVELDKVVLGMTGPLPWQPSAPCLGS